MLHARFDSPRRGLLERIGRLSRGISSSEKIWSEPLLDPGELDKHVSKPRLLAVADGNAYKALLLQRYYTVFDPYTVASHQVGQHHVGGESVPDNGNLARAGDASFWVFAEVLHDLKAAARFLGLMREHCHAS